MVQAGLVIAEVALNFLKQGQCAFLDLDLIDVDHFVDACQQHV